MACSEVAAEALVDELGSPAGMLCLSPEGSASVSHISHRWQSLVSGPFQRGGGRVHPCEEVGWAGTATPTARPCPLPAVNKNIMAGLLSRRGQRHRPRH